ncbi:MAG: hypothetical protein QNK60_02620 [Flavobacteriales bacterium]
MKKTILLILGLVSINLNAQNEIDALRYSTQNIFGTAKFNSMGGSFGSLGGDFSTLSYNPAGIAFYNNSEISFTPSLNMNETNTSLNGNNFTNNNFGANISNFGFIAKGINDNQQWKRVNIGFGWNQLANYNSIFHSQTLNSTSSLAETFLYQAEGTLINELNSFGASPAFWSDLIDLQNNFVDTATGWYAFDNGNYVSNVNPYSEKTQIHHSITEGNMGEYVFSLGSSFEENIYFGATIGIPTIQYSEKNTYSESNFSDTNQNLNSFTYKDQLNAYGSGVNLKLGVIMRVGENTKIGGAVHSPSYISMEEEYSTGISTDWGNNESIEEISPLGYFTYEITTPWKVIVSASTVLNKQFLISAEIEKTDYSFSRFHSDYYQFTEENNLINDTYTTATNIRLGGEANFHPLKLRAGYALYGSPYKDREEFETENYSAGIGVDFGSTFLDMSYTISKNNSEYNIYSSENATDVSNEKHYLMFTLGFRY